MDIQIRKESSASVLTISGRMDAVTAPEFEKVLLLSVSEGVTAFIVDFQHLEYISSAGLRVLLASAKLLKGKSGQIRFANITGTVKEVFDISGFCSIFQIHDSAAAALAEIS